MGSELTRRRRVEGVRHWFSQSELERAKPSFDVDVVEEMCDRISRGETLESICSDEGMPSLVMVHYWRRQDSRIGAALLAAKQAAAERLWAAFPERLEEAFADVEDKAALFAAEKKMALYHKWLVKEVGSIIPHIYGTPADRAGGGPSMGGKQNGTQTPPTLAKAVEQMRREGVAVVERVIEVPAKVVSDPPPRDARDAAPELPEAGDIDVPAKVSSGD